MTVLHAPDLTGQDRDTLVRILRGAATDIYLYGHAKGTTLRPDGARCAGAAITLSTAARGSTRDDVATAQASACYELLRSVVHAEPVEWNDAPETAPVQVIAALRAAARKAATA